jgi:phenylacetaldehyde dehydrogenase
MALANDYGLLTENARRFATTAKQLFIGGRWVEPISGEFSGIIDPSHGGEIASIPRAGQADVDAAVAAARAALETGPWPRLRPHEREALMLRLADLIASHTEELAQIETVNSGKLIGNTRLFDAELSVYTLRYMAGWTTKISGKTMDLSVPYLPGGDFTGFTRRGMFRCARQCGSWRRFWRPAVRSC